MKRIPLCLLTAMVIADTAYIACWQQYRDVSFRDSAVGETWQVLTRLRESIERHRQFTGRLPPSLTELDVVKKKEGMSVDDGGQPVDRWHNPLQYRVEGDRYTLLSLGADGEPGGSGVDADIDIDHPEDLEKLSLWRFTTMSETGGMKFTCLAAGLFALPLWLLQRPQLSNAGRMTILAVHAVTALFAVWVAGVIGILHLPVVSGH
jgi:Type II secretion system (T2SS), protein G